MAPCHPQTWRVYAVGSLSVVLVDVTHAGLVGTRCKIESVRVIISSLRCCGCTRVAVLSSENVLGNSAVGSSGV